MFVYPRSLFSNHRPVSAPGKPHELRRLIVRRTALAFVVSQKYSARQPRHREPGGDGCV